MTHHRDHFGPPYTDAELVEELVAADAAAVTPELEELAEYVAGRLPPWQHDVVTHRLQTDATFRAWAAPLLALHEHRPRAIHDVTTNDILRLERNIARQVAGETRGAATGELTRRKRVVRGLFAQFVLVWGFVVAIPVVLILNRSRWLAPEVVEVTGGRFGLPGGGAIDLRPGARLSWQPRPNSLNVYQARLDGGASITLGAPLAIDLATRSARIDIRRGAVIVEDSPAGTRVTLTSGEASVTPLGLSDEVPTRLRLNSPVDVRYATAIANP